MENNNQKTNNAMEIFKKTFNTEEKLQKQFHGMGDLISRYVMEVAENENPDEQFINQIIKSHFVYELLEKDKFTRSGYNYKKIQPDTTNLNKLSIQTAINDVKDYDEQEFAEYLSEFFYDDKALTPAENSLDENDIKRIRENEHFKQFCRIQTLIHEYNHTACHTKQIFINSDNEKFYTLPNKCEERKNGTIIRYAGGLPTKYYKFDEMGKTIKCTVNEQCNRLHEGITEYLTHKQIRGKNFDDYMIGDKSLKESENYYQKITYFESYLFTSMAENLFDNALTKSYRGAHENDSVVFKNLKQIYNLYSPFCEAINKFHAYKSLDKTKAVSDIPEYKNLLSAINNLSTEIKQIANDKLKANTISQAQYNNTMKTLKNFTLGRTMETALQTKSQLNFMDKFDFFSQLKQDLGNTQLNLFNKKYLNTREIDREV